MFKNYKGILFAVLAGVLFVYAGPVVQFESTEFDGGTLVEGKDKEFKAVFVVKNIGDATLIIDNIRYGCGCTIAKWDSVIAPGKSGKINAVVQTETYHGRHIETIIKVHTNVQVSLPPLIIKATQKLIIEPSTDNLIFPRLLDSPVKFTLTTNKKDFNVTGMSYRGANPIKNSSQWQNDMALPLKFNFVKIPISNTYDGEYVFELEVSPPPIAQTETGELIITTNYPGKAEISISTSYVKEELK